MLECWTLHNGGELYCSYLVLQNSYVFTGETPITAKMLLTHTLAKQTYVMPCM